MNQKYIGEMPWNSLHFPGNMVCKLVEIRLETARIVTGEGDTWVLQDGIGWLCSFVKPGFFYFKENCIPMI